MCCMQLAVNTACKNDAINRHMRTIAQLCRAISSQLSHVSTIGRRLLNANISSTCPYNMVKFGSLAAEINLEVAAPQQISTGFLSWLRYCDVAHRRPTKLCTMFGCLLGWYTVFIFGGSCPVTEFCQVQNSLCVQVLPSPILAALLHSTPAAGISQTLQRDTRNGITELSAGSHHVWHRPTF